MKTIQKVSRQKRVRARVQGTALKPRLSVFRSNRFIYAQVINDELGQTLVAASETELKQQDANKTNKATELGKLIAKKTLGKKVSEVIFDRGSYKYHGRVKAVAQGAREGGLKF